MLRRTRPQPTPPVDFDAFWTKTVYELRDLPSAATREAVSVDPDLPLRLERLTFVSLGGVRIHGYTLRWTDGEARPLVVHSHGYGSETTVAWPWAKRGMHVVGVDIRGFGRSAAAVPDRSRWGYMLTGVESPERHVLRGAICDYLQAARLGQDFVDGPVCRTVLHGVSFAGGLALMAEAVHPTADLLVVGVPTFGWAEGRQFFVQSGSGREIIDFLRHRPEYEEDLMVVLRYFDAMNFAGRIRCPTVVGVGLVDDVVPAQTVYAIANHLAGPHEILELPVSHSEEPEERFWGDFETRWLELAIEGPPEGFGRSDEARIREVGPRRDR